MVVAGNPGRGSAHRRSDRLLADRLGTTTSEGGMVRRWFYRRSLRRDRLFEIIMATAPVSYWISQGGVSQQELREKLALRYPR